MNLKHLYYGWVIVILAIFIQATTGLIPLTFGIFLTPLATEFNWDRGALSGAFSICLLLIGLLGIFAGRLSDKYGPRPLITINGVLGGTGFLLMSQVSSLWQVYLIWGLLFGVAAACCMVPIMSAVPRWFAQKRGIAIGLTAGGTGLGGIVSPPLAQWLISSYGWQQAYVILGLITFIIVIPLAQFMRQSPQRIELKPYGESGAIEDKQSSASVAEGLSLKQVIKTGRFWIVGLIQFGSIFSVMLITAHIVPHAVDTGITAMVAAGTVSIIGGCSLVGNFFIGSIADRIGARPALTACAVAITLAFIWLLFAKEIWMFYVFAVVLGIALGGILPLFTLIPAELFGTKFLGTIFGVVHFFGTAGGAVGPLLAGTIFDVTGSYNLAFLICLVIGALSIILSLILLKAKG